uniref:uncharacterized protein LOC122588081 n=1 Tax=Erigeron canadensis TaxID=72917 RepID=UPI001CB946D9|nr:uncharacterized protein LOC122588081 [Erigeron canadensis]
MGDLKKRNEQYCEFHSDKGHHTNDCWQLKRQIEDAVKSGQLAHLVREIKEENKGARGGRQSGSWNKERDNRGKMKEVQMFGRSQMGESRKRKIPESWMNVPITFPPPGMVDLTANPMIITGIIGDQRIHRIYIDGGASVELMYEHCFLQLPAQTRQLMTRAEAPLVGFAGEVVWPLGQILLPIKLGEPPLCRTEEMDFAVVRAPSSRYNMIIGRPGMRTLGAVTSTPHAEMRFPTPWGVAIVSAEMAKVDECQRIEEDDLKFTKESRNVKEERVMIHPHYPD